MGDAALSSRMKKNASTTMPAPTHAPGTGERHVASAESTKPNVIRNKPPALRATPGTSSWLPPG